jgi:hypothetical protein
MQKTGNLKRLLTPHQLNLLLAIPIGEIGTQILFGFGISILPPLLIPHLICVGLFFFSVLIELKQKTPKTWSSMIKKQIEKL